MSQTPSESESESVQEVQGGSLEQSASSQSICVSQSSSIPLTHSSVAPGLIAIFVSDNPTIDSVGILGIIKSFIDVFIRIRTEEPIRAL